MNSNPLPVRSPLDVLQLDFPHYRITMRNITGKLFYLAEARDSHVQPWFAQAETVERLRGKLKAPVREFTTTEPSIARVWDVLLGGKDNFAVDREQAAGLLKVFPHAAELARESRQFQCRAVTYVAGQGVRQFIDAGCGLPSAPNTHETAQGIQPGAMVVYADNDEQVLSHARSILARAEGVLQIAGDIGYPDEILCDWHVRQALGFHQPICVVMTMTLHFYDTENARRIAAGSSTGSPTGATSSFLPGSWRERPATSSRRSTRPGNSIITLRRTLQASWTASGSWIQVLRRRANGVRLRSSRRTPAGGRSGLPRAEVEAGDPKFP